MLYNVDSDNCANDRLRISSKGGQLKTTCGTGSPGLAVFEGEEIYIEFTTNGAINNFGFMLSYKLINISAALPQGTYRSNSSLCSGVFSTKTESDRPPRIGNSQ